MNQRIGEKNASIQDLTPPVRFLVLLLLALPAVASAQRSDTVSPAYEAVVRRYLSGDRQSAIAETRAWTERRLREEMTALVALCREARACHRCHAADSWQKIPVKAALMLHSDGAQKARRDGQPPRLQEWAAVEIARLLKDDPETRAFARRWYEAMASLAQAEDRWDEALQWAERGLRDCPESVEMRLVQASIEEVRAAHGGYFETGEDLVDPNTRRSRSELLLRREVRLHLEKAERALRAAVAADPSLVEPRLRLGRVAWRLGEAAEARSLLEDVLARQPDGKTAFLAHLFLGRLDEDAGRLDEAARSYEAALALDARAQSARLALSHVRQRRGEAASARSDVEKALGSVGLQPRQDPFWAYPWGPSVGVEERLETLRREVSP